MKLLDAYLVKEDRLNYFSDYFLGDSCIVDNGCSLIAAGYSIVVSSSGRDYFERPGLSILLIRVVWNFSSRTEERFIFDTGDGFTVLFINTSCGKVTTSFNWPF